VRKANVDNKLAWANGSWDPTVGFEYQRTQPDNRRRTLALPIRIFDKNQARKRELSSGRSSACKNREQSSIFSAT